jgi:hypothetical protein
MFLRESIAANSPEGKFLFRLRQNMVTYEQLLDRDFRWALEEGSRHFEKESAVHRTLRKITRKLDELGVPYAVAEGMARFFHGFRRFTEDGDIPGDPRGLAEDPRGTGRARLPASVQREQEPPRCRYGGADRVPGDRGLSRGRQAPAGGVSRPGLGGVDLEGMHFLNLVSLIELKLASGMTNPLRLKDIVAVQELIQVLALPEDLADRLNPFVRDKYRELWKLIATHSQKPL